MMHKNDRIVMKSCAIAMVALSAIMATESRADEWTGKDKAGHVQAGALIGSLTTAISKSETAGCLTAVGAGVAKEVFDMQHPESHTASYKDAIVTAAAGCLAAKVTGIVVGPRFLGWKKEF